VTLNQYCEGTDTMPGGGVRLSDDTCQVREVLDMWRLAVRVISLGDASSSGTRGTWRLTARIPGQAA